MDVVSFPWERLTVTMLLGGIVYGAVVELWVSGRSHRRQLAERDARIAKLEGLLERAVGTLRRAVDAAEKDKAAEK